MSVVETKERVAIVTGGASGIGREVVRILASEGIHVVINYFQSKSAAHDLLAELSKTQKRHVAIYADVTKEADVCSLINQVLEIFGRIDILVNNAGGSPCRRLISDLSSEEWDATLLLNLTAPFFCCRTVLPHLRSGASIVNISSSSAFSGGSGGSVHYAAAKAGLIAFTKGLAAEVAKKRIRVNAVAPGAIDTPFHKKTPPSIPIEKWSSLVPLSRIGSAEDVARIIVFLTSDATSFVTGQTFHVNGGLLMV